MQNNNKTVVLSGSQGFLGTYLSLDLLSMGYNVIGLDNFSKYGKVERPQDHYDNFTLLEYDLENQYQVSQLPRSKDSGLVTSRSPNQKLQVKQETSLSKIPIGGRLKETELPTRGRVKDTGDADRNNGLPPDLSGKPLVSSPSGSQQRRGIYTDSDGLTAFSEFNGTERSQEFQNAIPLRPEGTESPCVSFYERFITFWSYLKEADYFISLGAAIGGIEYFNRFSGTLLRINERINAHVFESCSIAFKQHKLKKIVVVSSSMVHERTNRFPTPEEQTEVDPPPVSTYGYQKLMCEVFARGYYNEFGLPYTIVRPFNACGSYELKAKTDDKMMLSHVLPDLIMKCLRGQNPLEILGDGNQSRAFTNGKDIARGIRLAMEDTRLNETYNISTLQETTILELAEKVWLKINPNKPFNYKSIPALNNDVQRRIPDTTKARDLLGFEAEISLDESIDECVEYLKSNYKF